MDVRPVSEALATVGLSEPVLNALVANEDNYRVLILQPHGHIELSSDGVRNKDRVLARNQFGRFLEDAVQTQADLVVTPEYSMPWEILADGIKAGVIPAQRKLWALGCEGIKSADFGVIKADLAPFATVIHEPLPEANTQFLSALAYVFLATPMNGGGAAKPVVLVQFKTHPMGDADHIEIAGLHRGTLIYQFGGTRQNLKLVSLICSDAFAFDDNHAREIYDRALVLHIQLNPQPRHEQFLGCRERLLKYGGDATEVLCLNWAADVQQCCGDQITPWHNISGSAWYLKPNEFDQRDATLCANHRRGLYYTWLKPRYAHALFFNFKPATYLLEATKVAHIGVPGAMSRRRGPQLTKTCTWNNVTGVWADQATAEDGFSALVDESGHAKDEIRRIADRNPLEAERVLALCSGKIGNSDEWHRVNQLDSCVIDSSEVICRVTFCQDSSTRAHEFRVARLRRCARLWDILNTYDRLPPSLKDFKDGFSFEWSPKFPHQNALSVGGQRATVVYMGEDASFAEVEKTQKRIAEFLHRASTDEDERRASRQRLAVWFRENREIVLFEPDRYVRIDQTGMSSEFDIGREA